MKNCLQRILLNRFEKLVRIFTIERHDFRFDMPLGIDESGGIPGDLRYALNEAVKWNQVGTFIRRRKAGWYFNMEVISCATVSGWDESGRNR